LRSFAASSAIGSRISNNQTEQVCSAWGYKPPTPGRA
jgi:hypothetical protein